MRTSGPRTDMQLPVDDLGHEPTRHGEKILVGRVLLGWGHPRRLAAAYSRLAPRKYATAASRCSSTSVCPTSSDFAS